MAIVAAFYPGLYFAILTESWVAGGAIAGFISGAIATGTIKGAVASHFAIVIFTKLFIIRFGSFRMKFPHSHHKFFSLSHFKI